MSIINKKIRELAAEHDCVVLPGLGAFIARTSNAQVVLERNYFSPPVRTISFNRTISKDDGLLTNEVAHDSDIPHSEAVQRVNAFIEKVKIDLNTKGHFSFEDFGVLRKKENGYAFTPFHPEESNLGLPSFYLKPLIRDIKEAENIDNEVVVTKESSQWRRIAIALLVLPFALYLFWVIAFSGIFLENRNISLSSFNPIRIPEKSNLYEVRPAHPDFEEVVVKDKPVEVDMESKDEPAKVPLNKNYYVVAGCFRDEMNAQSFVSELKKEGFEAEIFDQKNDLYRVSLAAYANEKDARKMLLSIQRAYKDAWIYRRL